MRAYVFFFFLYFAFCFLFYLFFLRGLDNKRSENGVGMNVNDIFRGAERIEITWPIACR